MEAYDQGLAGVVLSNHGGRQLDFARSGLEVLVEVVQKFNEKRGITFPNPKFQLFIDGGVRRATDVLKAVALGATAGMSTSRLMRLRTELSPHSRYRPAFHLCLFCVWAGGCGACSADSPGESCSYVPQFVY